MNMFRKGLAVAVILLFIGVAFTSSINANVSKESVDSELVEFTTEVCGIKGVKPHTVSLSKEDADEVDRLFDSIKERLDKVETREEAVEIFNEAVVELDKYGLLGGLSVKQAQKLVTGYYNGQNSQKKIINPNMGEEALDEYHNSFCFVVGNDTTWTRFIGAFLSRLSMFFALLLPDIPNSIVDDMIFVILFFFAGIYEQFKPIAISQSVGFGIKRIVDIGGWVYYPAEGRISTFGVRGAKTWSGPFYGSLGVNGWMVDTVYTGILGFFGIKIGEHYFGFAAEVGLQRERP